MNLLNNINCQGTNFSGTTQVQQSYTARVGHMKDGKMVQTTSSSIKNLNQKVSNNTNLQTQLKPLTKPKLKHVSLFSAMKARKQLASSKTPILEKLAIATKYSDPSRKISKSLQKSIQEFVRGYTKNKSNSKMDVYNNIFIKDNLRAFIAKDADIIQGLLNDPQVVIKKERIVNILQGTDENILYSEGVGVNSQLNHTIGKIISNNKDDLQFAKFALKFGHQSIKTLFSEEVLEKSRNIVDENFDRMVKDMQSDDSNINAYFGKGGLIESLTDDQKASFLQAIENQGGPKGPLMQVFTTSLGWSKNLSVNDQMQLGQQLVLQVLGSVSMPPPNIDDSGKPIYDSTKIPSREEIQKTIDFCTTCVAMIDKVGAGENSLEKHPCTIVPGRLVAEITRLQVTFKEFEKQLSNGNPATIADCQKELSTLIQQIPKNIENAMTILKHYDVKKQTINGISCKEILDEMSKMNPGEKIVTIDSAINNISPAVNEQILKAAGLPY